MANCYLAEEGGAHGSIVAEEIIREVLALDLVDQYRSHEGHIQVLLAEALVQQHRFDEATAILDEWQESVRSNASKYIRCWFLRAMICKLSGDIEEAREYIQNALDLAVEHALPHLMLQYHQMMRDISRDLQDLEAYVRHNDAVIEVQKAMQLQEASRNVALQEQERLVTAERQERERERAVLYSTLPAHIANRVIRGEDVSGDDIDEAAVMFMDIVGFTTLSSSMTPKQVTVLLDEVFTICNKAVAEHGVTRIKTIGDSYMAVAFPETGDQKSETAPAQRAVQAALEIRQRLAQAKPDIAVRIGLHIGPVVAGVIGREHLQYDVWGDTVNMASRMESTGEPGRIQCSEVLVGSLTSFRHDADTRHPEERSDEGPLFTFRERGAIEVKGKGLVTTYWVEPS